MKLPEIDRELLKQLMKDLIEIEDDLSSIKVTKLAHFFLRYVPTMGMQMQGYASRALILQFERDFPELYSDILGKLEEHGRSYIDSLHYDPDES